jgi:thiamine-phosphate pyrophosphorylase
VSIHSLSEALSAAEGGASWLIAGNVFASACKPDAPARGLAFLAEVCRAAAPLPVYAIGGITRGNIAQAQDAGAAGACLRSACMEESWTRA